MTKREQLRKILESMHPSEAIALIESEGKRLRKANSIRINAGKKVKVDPERPDLVELKSK